MYQTIANSVSIAVSLTNPIVMLYDYTMKLLLWRRTNREDSAGWAPLYLRITIAGKRAEFETDIKVPAAYWPERAKKIILPVQKSKRLPELSAARVEELNGELDELRGRADRHYKDLRAAGKERTAPGILQLLRGVPIAAPAPVREELTVAALADLFMLHTEAMPEEVRKTKSTLDNYRARLKNVKRFISEGMDKPRLLISQVNKPLLRRFERWCLTNGFGPGSMRKQINMLQMLISYAVHEDLLENDTVHGYKYQTDNVKKVPVHLPLAQVMRLQVTEWEDEPTRRAVAGWLFCAYTGLSWIDYTRFAKNPAAFLHTDEEGQQWIRMVRQKMQRRKPAGFSVPLFEEARALLYAWRNRLPVTVGCNVNKRLHHVETMLDIEQSLTTKLARATFSQLKRDEGYSDEVVAAWMGDTVDVMNGHYSRISEQRSKEEMRQIAERPVRKLIPLSTAMRPPTDDEWEKGSAADMTIYG